MIEYVYYRKASQGTQRDINRRKNPFAFVANPFDFVV